MTSDLKLRDLTSLLTSRVSCLNPQWQDNKASLLCIANGSCLLNIFNPIALRTAKNSTLHSECNRVNTE